MLPFTAARRALFGGVAIMGGGPPPKTYADWVAHITARATGGSKDQLAFLGGGGLFRVTLAAGAGNMYGSSWMSVIFPGASQYRRVIQHGLPNQVVFDAQVSGGREVIILMSSGPDTQVFNGLSRNGFTSSGATQGSPQPSQVCTLVGWWDETTQSALMMNPQAGTGPVPYSAPGWP